MGKSFLRSFSVWTTFLPVLRPQRFARRWMWVSTGKAGMLKDWTMTTEAVLCPTPWSDSSSSRDWGTSALYFSRRVLERATMARDLLLERPQGRMIS